MCDIIQLSAQDAPQMAMLYEHCFEDTWDVSFFEAKLQTSCLGYGSFKEQMLIGFILLQVVKDEGEILTFCVQKKERKKGLGTSILKFCLKQSKILTCFLEVNSKNLEAITLYKQQNFIENSLRINYYTRINGDPEDAIIYRYSKK